MGSGISVVPPKESNDKLRALLGNKKKMNKLFKTIATSGNKNGRIDISTGISLSELIVYFSKENRDPALKGFSSDASVCREAFKLITGRTDAKAQITKKKFRELIPTLFLFTELWKIFEIADDSIDDKRIFKGEYMRARLRVISIESIQIGNVTDDDWEKEFVSIDKDNSGFISFGEFCAYVVSHIVSPMNFITEDPGDDDDDNDEGISIQGSEEVGLISRDSSVSDMNAAASAVGNNNLPIDILPPIAEALEGKSHNGSFLIVSAEQPTTPVAIDLTSSTTASVA